MKKSEKQIHERFQQKTAGHLLPSMSNYSVPVYVSKCSNNHIYLWPMRLFGWQDAKDTHMEQADKKKKEPPTLFEPVTPHINDQALQP